MGKIITPVLPHDLPENWTESQYVSPGGKEVGLTEQHGFNYLMRQVNNAQKAINELDSGTALYGLIESYAVIQSAEELDPKLEEIVSGMSINTVKFVVIDFSANHPILGGGTRVLQINKNWEGYCVIHALGYRADADGAVSEFYRSRVNNVWTSWVRTYNTMFKPTHTDVGAAPHSLVYSMTHLTDASKFDSTILGLFNSMQNVQIQNFYFNCDASGAPLTGGAWYLTISRVNANLGTIFATKYSEYATDGGIMVRACSVHAGALTSWKSITGDGIAPASVE